MAGFASTKGLASNEQVGTRWHAFRPTVFIAQGPTAERSKDRMAESYACNASARMPARANSPRSLTTSMSGTPSCPWCDRPFRARHSGGRAQRFCRPLCRRKFHAAVRAWAVDAIARGALTVGDLKNEPVATRTLPPAPERATECSGKGGAITMILELLPNEVSDLIALGWLPAAGRGDAEVVIAAVVELVERALASQLRAC
jgi:hypothetical protein